MFTNYFLGSIYCHATRPHVYCADNNCGEECYLRGNNLKNYIYKTKPAIAWGVPVSKDSPTTMYEVIMNSREVATESRPQIGQSSADSLEPAIPPKAPSKYHNFFRMIIPPIPPKDPLPHTTGHKKPKGLNPVVNGCRMMWCINCGMYDFHRSSHCQSPCLIPGCSTSHYAILRTNPPHELPVAPAPVNSVHQPGKKRKFGKQ